MESAFYTGPRTLHFMKSVLTSVGTTGFIETKSIAGSKAMLGLGHERSSIPFVPPGIVFQAGNSVRGVRRSGGLHPVGFEQ
jgi:hypothetical protein